MSDGAPAATLQVDVYLTPEDRLDALRQDVLQGLMSTPKELPPKWFYDERGSMLFEEITGCPSTTSPGASASSSPSTHATSRA